MSKNEVKALKGIASVDLVEGHCSFDPYILWNLELGRRIGFRQEATTTELVVPFADNKEQARPVWPSSEMNVSSRARDFIRTRQNYLGALEAAESVVMDYYRGARLSLDLHIEDATRREYLCLFIEPEGAFEDAVAQIGRFNRSWLEAIGKELRGKITFALM